MVDFGGADDFAFLTDFVFVEIGEVVALEVVLFVDDVVVELGLSPGEAGAPFEDVGAGFSEAGGVVAGVSEDLGEGWFTEVGIGVGLFKSVGAVAVRVASGEHGNAGWDASGGVTVGVSEEGTFFCEGVDFGRGDEAEGALAFPVGRLVDASQGVRALIVGDDPEDVGLLCGGTKRARREEEGF